MDVLAVSMGFVGLEPALGLEPSLAKDMMTETFDRKPETRWRFLADTVMGGLSSGEIAFLKEGGLPYARLTGTVRTANRGGFIQMRSSIAEPLPAGTTGVRLIVRGNDQRYFVHLRTLASILPTQFYQAGFEVTGSWREVRLPFSAFRATGPNFREAPGGCSLTSIGIVAYGRDHEAEIDVREIGFYATRGD
jgi:hypothetical protein